MSLPRKISLKININNDITRLILQKSQKESKLHILLKILAYLYFVSKGRNPEKLIIEPDFRYKKYKPDILLLTEPINPKLVTPVVDLWVECKNVKLAKLTKLQRYLPNCDIYWFHKQRKMEKVLTQRNLKKYPRLQKIKTIGVKIEDQDLSVLKRSLTISNPKWSVNNFNSGEPSKIVIKVISEENYQIKIIFNQITTFA